MNISGERDAQRRTGMRRGLAAQAGMSILAALVFIGILGAVCLALQAVQPAGGNTLALMAATANTTAAGANQTQPKSSSITLTPGKANCGAGQPQATVNYACKQQVKVDDVQILQQTCSDGFDYKLTEASGIITAEPTSRATTKAGCTPPTPPKCPDANGKAGAGDAAQQSFDTTACKITYCLNVNVTGSGGATETKQSCPTSSGKTLAELRKSAAEDIILNKGLNPAQVAQAKEQLSSLPKNDLNGIMSAYVDKNTTAIQAQQAKNTSAINDLNTIIASCGTGPGPTNCDQLKQQRDQLQQQNATLNKELSYVKALTPEQQQQQQQQQPTGGCTSNCGPGNTNTFGGLNAQTISGAAGSFLGGFLKSMLGGGAGGSAGQSGSAQQCPSVPTKPDDSGCSVGYWQPIYSNNCLVSWRCTGSGNGGPTAQLSCQPTVADPGMTIAIAYSCSSGTAQSSDFSTGNKQSGTATVTLAAPSDSATNLVTYGLTCKANGQTASAQCSVQVNRPSIIFVANPKTVPSGQLSLLGWITTGMDSCVVSSPDDSDFTSRNAANTSANGTATTSPITATTRFTLHCTSDAGTTKDATTTVSVGDGSGTATSTSITVSSSADGGSITRGSDVSIGWNTTNVSDDARVALWLIKADGSGDSALIASALATSSTYTWHVPAAHSDCPTDGSRNVCGDDLTPGQTYLIEADVYTPFDAYMGDGPAPADPVSATYLDFADTQSFTVQY